MKSWNVLCAALLTPYFCFANLNFIHVPKTGGTTMCSLLDKNFRNSDYYPFLAIGKGEPMSRGVFDTEEDVLNVLNRFPMIKQKVAKGHLPFWFFQSRNPNFNSAFIFTTLREPVSRRANA